jgi:hypothetical protein
MEDDRYLVYTNNPEDAIDLVRQIVKDSNKVITDVTSSIAWDCEAYDVATRVKSRDSLI